MNRRTKFQLIVAALLFAFGASGAEMVVVSPPAFTNLWQAYVDYRAETHPGLSVEIANTADIYAAYPDAVAKGDYALAIHKHLEALYNGGNGELKIVLLGGAAPGRTSVGGDTNWHSFTNKFLPFNAETQIPTRYPVTVGNAAHEASDLYYACMDKSGAEAWDFNGDGVYMATLQQDGTMVNEAAANIDWSADIQVMRVPIQPLIVETTGGERAVSGDVTATITAAQQMTNFIVKLRYIESGAWRGEGEHALVGDTTLAGAADFKHGNTSAMYTGEREFFDGGLNFFSPDNRQAIVANEPTARHRAWQFFSGVRANGVTRFCIGRDWSLPDVYGSANDALSAAATQKAALDAIKASDHESFFQFSHGWARAAQPVTAPDLLNGAYTGVTRFYFAPEPCDTGCFDYAHKTGQTVTNAVCLGAAAVLAPGGAAVSFNNSRIGISAGLDNGLSSALEGWLMCAVYNGNCTNTLFDANNPAVSSPITAGQALLLMRQRAIESGKYNRFDASTGCLMQLNGFGDPLMTLSTQRDAADDLSTPLNRVLSLSSDTVVSSTNAAAKLFVGENVSSVSGDGILRATAETEIASPSLAWSVAGGMGRKVKFANAGGRLVFPGAKKRYIGRSFENVGEIAATGSGLTVDFGTANDNAASPVAKVAFISETGGTNTLRFASKSSGFFAAPIAASNSVLRAETSAPFDAALTNATLLAAPNLLWSAVNWNTEVGLNASTFAVGHGAFTLSNASFRVSGDKARSSVVDETGSCKLKVNGAISVSLADDATFSADSGVVASALDGSLKITGRGMMRFTSLPLVGFTNVTVGSGVSLVVPETENDATILIAGGPTSSVVFEGTASVFPEDANGNLGWINNPTAVGGTIYPNGATGLLASPYARTLSASDEYWIDSSDWTANGAAFGKTWAKSLVDSAATVALSVADGADAITLAVEDAVSVGTLTVANAPGASAPGNLSIVATNGLFAENIDATGFSGSLALDFPLYSASLSVNADTHILQRAGNGSLYIPTGSRATLYDGAWQGRIVNAGVYKLHDETTNSFTLAGMVAGTNSYYRGTCANNMTDTSGKALLVEDGDAVELSGDKHTIGFAVTGGRLKLNRPNGFVWIGSLGSSLPFTQSGGTTTVHTAESTIADTAKGVTQSGLLLCYTGDGYSIPPTYFVTVSGGRFEVPNAHINFWNGGTDFTVAGAGVVAAKGVSSTHANYFCRDTYNHFNVLDGGTFEMGEIGICSNAPVVRVSGGTIIATANASIRAAITLNNATLAAASGKTLTLAAQPSASGTLTIGKSGCSGIVDIGTNRFPNATLAASSCGTLAVTFTDAESAASSATLYADGAEPKNLSVACSLPDGSTTEGMIVASGSSVKVIPVARTLQKPIAVWNGDMADGLVRGSFKCFTQGNSVSGGEVTMTSKGLIFEHSNHLTGTNFPGSVVAGISNAGYSTGGVRALLMQYLPFYGVEVSEADKRKAKYGLSLSTANRYLGCYSANLSWKDFGVTSDLSANGARRYIALAHKGKSDGTQFYVDGSLVYNASGLHEQADATYRGYVIGGRYGIADNLCTGMKVSYVAILPTSDAATVAAWSLTNMTDAETVASGGTIAGGASVGVNLNGGTVRVEGDVAAAALFVQSNTTLVFGDGAFLSVSGPVYIADGAKLTVKTASGLDYAQTSRTLVTSLATAYGAEQIVCGHQDDASGKYSVSSVGGRVVLRYTPTQGFKIRLF